MGIKHDLKRSIYQILDRNSSGSFATQANRRYILSAFANDLVSIGFGLRNAQGLKQKHIIAIVEHWKSTGLSSSTIKNRTAALRFLCEKINKKNIMTTNKQLNISPRQYKLITNKAIFDPDFSRVHDPYIKISLELQRTFGLRREEALKIKPHMADKGSRIELMPTWCKGGRGRHVPITTEEQRYWLDQAKKLVEKWGNSLVPQHKTYIQQRYLYDKQALRADLRNLHGLRHAYAQRRYKQLTGSEPPINGGLTSKQLTKHQKQIDYQARMALTEELGHSREQITVNYLGR